MTMKKKLCPLEKDIMTGLRDNNLETELQKHISECRVCKDVIAVHAWMNRFKEQTWQTVLPEKTLPGAEALWNSAQSRRKPDERMVKKALRPLIYPQLLSFAVFFAGIIFFGIKGFPSFGNFFDTSFYARIFPFFLILMSLVFLFMLFSTLPLIVEKRKNSV